jgi:hypothetical protein
MPTPFFYYSATYARSPFTLTATTASSSQVVTIQRLTLNGAQILSWGDGQFTTITSGSTGTWPHTYASAGTYTITLPNARGIIGLQLQDAKLGALKTSQLRQSSLNYFYVTAITASTISSADMSAWRPTNWIMYSMPAGGTYTISSADMSAWTGITILNYYSMPSAITVTANTLSTQVAMTTLNLSNDALAAAAVNQVLADLVTSISGRGGVKCTTTLNGTNAAPTGTGITNKATLVAAGWTVTTN